MGFPAPAHSFLILLVRQIGEIIIFRTPKGFSYDLQSLGFRGLMSAESKPDTAELSSNTPDEGAGSPSHCASLCGGQLGNIHQNLKSIHQFHALAYNQWT